MVERSLQHGGGSAFPPPWFLEAFFLCLFFRNASLIDFSCFQIISFRLPLLIFKPPRLSVELHTALPWLHLFPSLPLNAHSIDVSPSICDAFPPFSFPPLSPTFYLSKVLCSVFSPGAHCLMHTDTSGF